MLRLLPKPRASTSAFKAYSASLFSSAIRPASFTRKSSFITSPFSAVGFSSYRHFSSQNALVTLIDAVQRRDKDTIHRIAIAAPRMIIEQTSNDNTALHEAAKRGDVEMIITLSKVFSANFNVNHKCHCYLQRTPLAYAVEGGHIAAVEILLSLGADPNIRDEKNRTGLDYAVDGIYLGKNKSEFEKIGVMLMQKGGKANKFTEEAKKLFSNFEANRFLEEYKIPAREKVAVMQQQFLEERKKLSTGRPS